MIDNTGFVTYAMFHALKLHFTSDSYDYVKYHGKTNLSKQTFSTRKDKYSFYKLSRKYSLDELKNFLVANFLVKDITWVGDLLGPEGEENYIKWQKRNQALTYTFKNDMMYLLENFDRDKIFIVENGNYPVLLQEMMRNKISIETLMILENQFHFIELWSKKISDDIIWPNIKRRIMKYKPFVNYDNDTFMVQTKELLKEYA
jgi:hypothetical protein